jgi:hypothetical protein
VRPDWVRVDLTKFWQIGLTVCNVVSFFQNYYLGSSSSKQNSKHKNHDLRLVVLWGPRQQASTAFYSPKDVNKINFLKNVITSINKDNRQFPNNSSWNLNEVHILSCQRIHLMSNTLIHHNLLFPFVSRSCEEPQTPTPLPYRWTTNLWHNTTHMLLQPLMLVRLLAG